MADTSLLWKLAYHLGGPTISGRTPPEPLGSLPINVRTAVLKTLAEFAPDAVILNDVRSESLKYVGQDYEWIAHWSLKDKRWADMIMWPSAGKRLKFPSVQEYFEYHKLLKPKYKPEDEHFAEREFVERVFLPVFDLEGLSYLIPQVKFKDSESKTRRIDFVLEGVERYAIEIEGETYHGKENISSEQFDDEKQRQRDIYLKAGYIYTPFSYSQVKNGSAKAVLADELPKCDTALARLAIPAPSEHYRRSNLTHLEQFLCWMPVHYPLYQQAALALLWEAVKQQQSSLVIADLHPAVAILALALLDMTALIERVADLYGLPVILPEVTLYIIEPTDEWGTKRLLANYLLSEDLQSDRRVDRSRAKCRLVWGTELPSNVDAKNIFSAASLERQQIEDTEVAIKTRIAAFLNMVGSEPPLEARAVSPERATLDYFARRYFLVPELKMEQVSLIQRALRNESGLGILPTAFGKSIVFQLYSLLVPHTTIVISPLRSLIRDQIHNLKRVGLQCAEAITSFDSPAEKDAKLKAFQGYRYRLLYISPERIQIKRFVDEVKATIAKTPIGALAIDEAHCVSEWGHDFRPAYLQLRRFRETLEEASGRPVPIIALTATASEMVRKDILAVLGLLTESVEQLRSSDRPNISFSVHSIESPEQKIAALENLIHDTIPSVLDISTEGLLSANEQTVFPHAGVIFGIYANPHGRSTIIEGVHYIADKLRQRLNQDDHQIQVYASTAPQVCPECQSPLYISGYIRKAERANFIEDSDEDEDDDDEILFKPTPKSGGTCLKCGAKFTRQPGVYPKWDDEILARQDDFQTDQFPMLVATKGYGMGIDKRNIRYIVHHALSSGLEGYYQEVGRAGRDNEHSHVALIYSPPHPPCRERYILSSDESVIIAGPPCVSEKKNYFFHKCPYYDSHLCDYGYQSRFIQSSYPGVDKDTEQILAVYRQLVSGEDFLSQGDDHNRKNQLALYRLQQLGIIKSYNVKYLSLEKMVFDVDFDPNWTYDLLLQYLADFLKRTGAIQSQIDKVIQTVMGPKPEQDAKAAILEHAATALLKQIYITVGRMRYQMLRNELRYATVTEGECRRNFILSIFDDHPPSPEYRCNFCDSCVPALNFDRERAEIVTVNAHVDEIAKQLPVLFEKFDPMQLPEVVQRIIDYGAAPGMFNRTTNRLEHDPNNPAALFVAGSLGRISSETQQESLGYLKRGFDQGIWQGVPKDGLLLFYREAKPVDPKESFDWLTDAEGPWDNQDGLKFLHHEAHEIFGADAEESRGLAALREIRSEREVANDLKSLVPVLDILTQGFEQLTVGLE